jgi:hypothetical protein
MSSITFTLANRSATDAERTPEVRTSMKKIEWNEDFFRGLYEFRGLILFAAGDKKV